MNKLQEILNHFDCKTTTELNQNKSFNAIVKDIAEFNKEILYGWYSIPHKGIAIITNEGVYKFEWLDERFEIYESCVLHKPETVKEKVIKQLGIVVKGEALINLWGGGQGWINMDSSLIENKDISKSSILGAVNDGQFGCESIESADIDIYIHYDNGSNEYDRTIFADHPIHTNQFGKRGI